MLDRLEQHILGGNMRPNTKRSISILRVPVDDSCVSIVGASAAAALRSSGMSESRANEARCVIEALCLDAMHRSHESPEDDPWIELIAETSSGGVDLRLHDRGLPIGPNRTAIRRAKQLAAAGCVDHLSVVGVSPNGPTAKVFVAFPPDTHAPFSDEPSTFDNIDPAPEDAVITLRRMVPGDAEAYARLAFRCYGYDYKLSAYDPVHMDENLRDGTCLAGIAENEQGETIGHVAYNRIRPGGSVVHAGAGMVDPRYRKRGLLGRLGMSVHEMIAGENLVGIISEPVMVHTVTQQQAHLIGYDTGIFLNWSNPRRVSGFEDTNPSGRVSVLCTFIPLAEIPHRDIYPPPSAIAYLSEVIRSSHLARRIHEPAPVAETKTKSAVASATDPGTGVAKLEVTHAGPDLIERIIELLDDALAAGSPVVILDLPLNKAAVGWFAAGVEELGFVFAALLPECGEDGDILRLQYVVDLDHDISDWKIDLPCTVELVSSVVHEIHAWHEEQSSSRLKRIQQWREDALGQLE